MPIRLEPLIPVSVGDTFPCAVDFQHLLDSGELLTGTPTVVEVTTTALTITGKAVSVAAKTINGRNCPIAMAVQFRVSGQLSGVTYTIRVTCATTDSNTYVREVRIIGI